MIRMGVRDHEHHRLLRERRHDLVEVRDPGAGIDQDRLAVAFQKIQTLARPRSAWLALVLAMIGFGLCKGLYDSGVFASLFDTIEPRARGTAAGLMNTVGWRGGAPNAVNLNPAGQGGDYLPFGMLCDMGFSVGPGQRATFRDVIVRNNRAPNNIQFLACVTGDATRARALHAQVLRVGAALYRIGQHPSAIIKGIERALACLGVCDDFMAEPFHRFRAGGRALVERRLAELQTEMAALSL